MKSVLEVIGLSKKFRIGGGFLGKPLRAVHAVSDVSFTLTKEKTLGIVGESGCGKSTTARLIIGLIEPDAGQALLGGKQVFFDTKSIREFRRNVQMVFQDSSASLNPRLTLEQSVMFGPMQHGVSRHDAHFRAHELLNKVGLEPSRFAGRYPHEISGGQRQRVNIARALALRPKVIIFDESVSALDKSVEAQVLNLLQDLKDEFGLSYIFISHDLNVVRYVSDDVVVMYLGQVVERGRTEEIFATPAHPYTRALLASMPSYNPEDRTLLAPISGDPPNPIDLPAGCRFAPRCSHAAHLCHEREPNSIAIGETGHTVSCFLVDPKSGHPEAEELVV